MVSKKYLYFDNRLNNAIDFNNSKKWYNEGNRVYKLLQPDLKTDMVYTYAQVKAISQDSISEKVMIRGIANANIVDRMDERLDPVGLIVDDYLKNPQLLAHHNYYCPIGQVETLEVQDDGVYFNAWIGDPKKSELTLMQKEIRSLVLQGILKTVSVGFIPKKIRAPLYNDRGEMEEPLVIEKWELLELSIVSVPCNQASVFEITKEITSQVQKSNAKIIPSIKTKQETDGMLVQTLIFSKSVFTREEAVKWALDHDFIAESIDETEDSYRLRQHDPDNFDQNSFRTITLTEGVQAVVGKLKDGKQEEGKQEGEEMLTLVRAMSEKQGRMMEILELVLAKLEEKSKPAEGDDSNKPKEDEEAKAMVARVEKLEKSFDKLVKSVSLIVEKLNK